MRPIVPLHTSYHDFLTNKKTDVFNVDIGDSDVHRQLAQSCLALNPQIRQFQIRVVTSRSPPRTSQILNLELPGMSQLLCRMLMLTRTII
jgi:hypothetical protein